MQFNTALCFVFAGTGLYLLTTRRPGVAPWLGGAAALLAGLTLVEYLTGRDLGIDLLFFKPYFEKATSFPGRMSPLAAACFICLGLGLVLAGAKKSRSRPLVATGLLASIVGVISGVALAGYLFGIDSAYGWGAYSRMAVNTAVALLLCASGLLAWVWQTAGREYDTLLRWIPATASVTLMTMVGFVASWNTTELRQATFWRQHGFQVILSAQAFLDNLLDLQRGMRGFVTLGDTNALAAYVSCKEAEPRQLDLLISETSDNASQSARLHRLDAAMKELLAYDEFVISVYREQGFPGVASLDAKGQSRVKFGNARELLKNFSAEEQRLLGVRDATETAGYNQVTRLLIAGCVAAALLLLAGNLMASREMKRRREAEMRLTATLTLQNAILSSANYAIVAMDRHGVIQTFNPAAEKMLGYRAEDVIRQATPQLWGEVMSAAPSKKIGMESSLARAGLAALGERETTFIRNGGERFPVLVSTTALGDARGEVTGFLAVFGDISERKLRETERERLIGELTVALAEVKTLSGLIPICAWCKNVRSDKGYWQTVEQYVHARTEATFTHGICPECAGKMMAETAK